MGTPLYDLPHVVPRRCVLEDTHSKLQVNYTMNRVIRRDQLKRLYARRATDALFRLLMLSKMFECRAIRVNNGRKEQNSRDVN